MKPRDVLMFKSLTELQLVDEIRANRRGERTRGLPRSAALGEHGWGRREEVSGQSKQRSWWRGHGRRMLFLAIVEC